MSPRRLAICCCVAAALLVAVPAGAQSPADERIAAGVSAAGLDVSGLTIVEAAAKIEQTFRERIEHGSISVRAAGLTWRLSTAAARARLDATNSARRALNAGREAAGAPVDVRLTVEYSKGAVNRFAGRIDRRLRRPARDARLKISIRRVRVTHSRRGRDIDGRGLARRIGKRLVDPRLSRELRARVRSIKPRVTANELRASGATVITIEQRTFTLRLFKNLRVVERYKVAVGLPAYPTPRGLFSIVSKQVNPVWSAPNSPWAGELAGTTVTGPANPLKARWMGIVNGVGIHGTALSGSIGTRASHGCIRMHVPDVIRLYRRVPIGTPVLIR